MKNKKLINYFKKYTLLFICLFLITNCNDDDLLDPNINTFEYTNNTPIIELIPYSEILINHQFLDIISQKTPKIKSLFQSKETFKKEENDNEPSFNIDKTNVRVKTTKDSKSYTFLLKNNDKKVLKNLVIEKTDFYTNSFIVTYGSKKTIAKRRSTGQLDNAEEPIEVISVEPIDNGPINYRSLRYTACGVITSVSGGSFCRIHPKDGHTNPKCGLYGTSNTKTLDIQVVYCVVPNEPDGPSGPSGPTGGSGSPIPSTGSGGGGGGGAGGSNTQDGDRKEPKFFCLEGNPITKECTKVGLNTELTPLLPSIESLFNLNTEQTFWANQPENKEIVKELTKFYFKSDSPQDAEEQVRAFINMSPSLKQLAQYWPKNSEEWAVIGDIFVEVMIQLIPELIPGLSELNSLKNSIAAFNSGSYIEGSTELGLAIVGIFPVGKALKAAAKSSKVIAKAINIFNKVRKFAGSLAKTIKKGFKTKITGNVIELADDAGNIIATGADDVGRVTVNIVDAVNDTQRNIISQWRSRIASQSNKRKGNFGEMATDLDLANDGYIPLHTRIDNIDAAGHTGIDAVMEKNGQYFIVESKFSSTSTPSLNPANPTTGLPKQMSDLWISRPGELSSVIGNNEILAQQILNSNYTRVLATHGPNGNKIYKLVDSLGNIGGVWTP